MPDWSNPRVVAVTCTVFWGLVVVTLVASAAIARWLGGAL